MLYGKFNFIIPVHIPFTDGCDDFNFGIQCKHITLQPHLIVPLPCAAVRNGINVVLLCHFNSLFGYDCPPHRSREIIITLITCVRLDTFCEKFVGKFILHIKRYRLDCPELQGFFLDGNKVILLLSDIKGKSNNMSFILILNPFEHHAGIKPAGVQE